MEHALFQRNTHPAGNIIEISKSYLLIITKVSYQQHLSGIIKVTLQSLFFR